MTSIQLRLETGREIRIYEDTIKQLLLAVRADLTNGDHLDCSPAAKVFELAEDCGLVNEDEMPF